MKKCKVCGKELKGSPSIIKKRIYCSNRCSRLGYYINGGKSPSLGLKGENAFSWKGGVSVSVSGSGRIKYKRIYIDGKRYREHRLIMERFIGRKLLKNEIVHHKDGNGLNNNIDNLELLTESKHNQITAIARWKKEKKH